jgi:hypothetical protein
MIATSFQAFWAFLWYCRFLLPLFLSLPRMIITSWFWSFIGFAASSEACHHLDGLSCF